MAPQEAVEFLRSGGAMTLSDELRSYRKEFTVNDYPGFGEPGATPLHRVVERLVESCEWAADHIDELEERVTGLKLELDAWHNNFGNLKISVGTLNLDTCALTEPGCYTAAELIEKELDRK